MAEREIALRLNGRIWTGWLSASATRGLDRLASSFSVTASRLAPGTGEPLIARPFDSVTVEVAGRRVLTGFVDKISPKEDAGDDTVTVSGRSRTADLIDCTAIVEPGTWRGARIDRIVRDLARPFGVEVRLAGDPGGPMDEDVQQGERVFDVIERCCRRRGLVARDTPDGAVVLERPSSRRSATALVNLRNPDGTATAESNVLRSSGVFDGTQRFSEIHVTSQVAGTDLNFGAEAAGVHAVVRDPAVPRHRPLLIVDEGSANAADCRLRAGWEYARRLGRSQTLRHTVSGWLQRPGGDLWDAGLLVPVRDRVQNVKADLIAASVTWTMTSDQADLTTLVLQPPESFEPERAASELGAFKELAELFEE